MSWATRRSPSLMALATQVMGTKRLTGVRAVMRPPPPRWAPIWPSGPTVNSTGPRLLAKMRRRSASMRWHRSRNRASFVSKWDRPFSILSSAASMPERRRAVNRGGWVGIA